MCGRNCAMNRQYNSVWAILKPLYQHIFRICGIEVECWGADTLGVSKQHKPFIKINEKKIKSEYIQQQWGRADVLQ